MIDQLLEPLLGNPMLFAPIGLILVLGLFALLLPKRSPKTPTNVTDPKVQLACVKKVTFATRPLLNTSEAKVFTAISEVLETHYPELRLMAQTSMGEVLSPNSGTKADQNNAFRSINSKRLDFAVFGHDQHLKLGIEYHGSGHFKGNAKARDAVKRAVFERAGLNLIELPAKATPQDIQSAIHEALTPN